MLLIYDFNFLYNNIFKKSIGFNFFLTKIVHIFVNPKSGIFSHFSSATEPLTKVLILTDL